MMLFLRFFTGFLTQVFPFGFLCIYPFKNHFRFAKKKTVLFSVILVFSLAAIFAAASCIFAVCTKDSDSYYGYTIVNSFFFVCLLVCLFWYLYIIRAIWQKKCFIFFFALTSALTITSTSNLILAAVPSEQKYHLLPYAAYTIPVLLLTTAVILPFLYLILKHYFIPMKETLSKREYSYLSVFSILIFIMLAGVLSYLDYGYLLHTPMALFLYISLFITIFIIYAIFFRMYLLSHEKYIAQQNSLQMQYQIELRDEQYRHIQENIENNRRLRHDLKHHLLTLQGFLADHSPEKAAAYLQEYVATYSDYEVENFCANPIVNMLLTHYSALAKDQQITFRIRINIPDQLSIQESDLSVLLGNLLENAMLAAGNADKPHRFIHLNMICSGNSLVITVDNGFDGKLRTENNKYLSTKPEHTGIGLSSLSLLAKKYHGGVSFSNEDMVFHSSIMLELEETR